MRQTDPRVIDRTAQILEYIIGFKKEHDGLSPTLRDIGAEFGLSVSHAAWYIDKLERDGLITTIRFGSRGIVVKGGKWTMEGVSGG